MLALRPVAEGERPPVLLLGLRQRGVPPCPQRSLLALLEERTPDASNDIPTYAPRCRCPGCPGRAAFVRSAETWRGQSPRPRPARSSPCLRKPNQTKRASDHSKARKEAGACGSRTHLAEGGGSGHADGQRPGPLISHTRVVVRPALAQILEPAERGAERRKPRDRQTRVVVAPCSQQRSTVRVAATATARADRCCTHRAL